MRHGGYSVGVIVHTCKTTDFPSEMMRSCKHVCQCTYMTCMEFLFKEYWLQRPVGVYPIWRNNSCGTTGF